MAAHATKLSYVISCKLILKSTIVQSPMLWYSFLYICSSFPCPLYYNIIHLLRYACFWPFPVFYLPPCVYWYIISSGIAQSLTSSSSFIWIQSLFVPFLCLCFISSYVYSFDILSDIFRNIHIYIYFVNVKRGPPHVEISEFLICLSDVNMIMIVCNTISGNIIHSWREACNINTPTHTHTTNIYWLHHIYHINISYKHTYIEPTAGGTHFAQKSLYIYFKYVVNII